MTLSLRHRQSVTVIRAGTGPLVKMVSNGVPYYTCISRALKSWTTCLLLVVCPCEKIVPVVLALGKRNRRRRFVAYNHLLSYLVYLSVYTFTSGLR